MENAPLRWPWIHILFLALFHLHMTCVSLDFHPLWMFDLISILVESRSLFSQCCLLPSDTYIVKKYVTCIQIYSVIYVTLYLVYYLHHLVGVLIIILVLCPHTLRERDGTLSFYC